MSDQTRGGIAWTDPYELTEPSGAPDDGGDMVPMRLRDRKGGDPDEWPEDLRVRQFPAEGK